ncbi:alpha-D-ribose 1-methylphosphonate 5-triphosphate diphosphatase [Advenella incenata]|jgi:alpha-D-ribose 1-methylphosphonate 5-triphosphate diphosphatase|uniref:Alpha-D-ribose 1-methylphosphonate 5-triphosphate diphosphatase n=1 Tax=Advenella incenata TaxID=267800 RepID=A0A4Q7VRF8_9BURK|nr:alpha-D-ribose 1-methylphosphonate 5-triphosphate diphosphatase [Advenella incenata]RZT99012.1 alpha-D-ribose 1-methylphosphonate 5-triphosphate diphosphatase [Advenella incenata]
MLRERVITNAKIVTASEVIRGTVSLRDGLIHDVSEGTSSLPAAEDWQGDFVIPGLIELHTDNLEKYMNPRPGVDWPSENAVLAHDAQIVAAAITTVFDALSIGDVNPKGQRLLQLPKMVEAISHASDQGHTRAEHRLHLRCEVSHEKTLGIFEDLVGNELVHLVSVMDHTPGQRQFVKYEKYREYYQGKYHLNDADMDAFIVLQKQNADRYSEGYRRRIVDICHERGLSLASHDDATSEHVHESAGFGMTIAEFPTTHEAAALSHQLGLKVLMGAPNVVRGGSHSGNIAATDLARNGVLDILSSDYYPASMLQSVRILSQSDLGISLPQAVNMVSLAPARSANLPDRGQISPGLRADLVQVKDTGGQFVVRQVLREGQRVF